MKKLIVFLLPLFVGALAVAGPKIKQINKGDDQIAVSASKQTRIGTQWVASQRSGSQCIFEVTQTSGTIAIMETDDCDFSQLTVGQNLQKSLFKSSSSQSRTTGKTYSWMKRLKGFSAVAFYSMADDLPYKTNGGGGTVSSSNAFGFGAEYDYSLARLTDGLPLVLVPGVTYELSRDFDSFSENGGPSQNFASKPSLGLWTLYTNAKYNFTDQIGGFAGLNYSLPMDSNMGTLDLKPALGYQLGVTGKLTDNIAVDGLYRWINMNANSGISDVSLDGLTIRGRYIF